MIALAIADCNSFVAGGTYGKTRQAGFPWLVVLASIFAFLGLCRISNAAIVTWSVNSGGNGHAYEFVDALVWWEEARMASLTRTPPTGFNTGALVTISSSAENAFVTQLVPESGSSWIGFTDQLIEGEWRWIDDTPGIWQDPNYFASPIQSAYVNWATGEPNNYEGNEDYGILQSLGAWNDGQGPMMGSKGAYIVEFSPLPEPSSWVLGLSGLAFTGWQGLRRLWRR